MKLMSNLIICIHVLILLTHLIIKHRSIFGEVLVIQVLMQIIID